MNHPTIANIVNLDEKAAKAKRIIDYKELKVEDGMVVLKHDIFTEALNEPRFENFSRDLGICTRS